VSAEGPLRPICHQTWDIVLLTPNLRVPRVQTGQRRQLVTVPQCGLCQTLCQTRGKLGLSVHFRLPHSNCAVLLRPAGWTGPSCSEEQKRPCTDGSYAYKGPGSQPSVSMHCSNPPPVSTRWSCLRTPSPLCACNCYGAGWFKYTRPPTTIVAFHTSLVGMPTGADS
jgi:hypothetical protein